MSQLEKLTEGAETFAKAYVIAKAELVRAGMSEEHAQEPARMLALDVTIDDQPKAGEVAHV